jgi:hypothetical protein
MGARVVTVNEVLDGHTALDIQCLDRIYLNVYVPRLQTSAQVVAFLTSHLGFPFPSPALFNQIGQRFRRAVASYAETNDIPWVQFDKDDDKLAVMRAHLDRQAATGRSRVAAIGVAQEFQRVWTALPGQGLAQRPRVGQTPSHQGRHRLHRAVQRIRRLRRLSRAAGHLRPARPGDHQRLCRTLAGSPTPSAHRHRP